MKKWGDGWFYKVLFFLFWSTGDNFESKCVSVDVLAKIAPFQFNMFVNQPLFSLVSLFRGCCASSLLHCCWIWAVLVMHCVWVMCYRTKGVIRWCGRLPMLCAWITWIISLSVTISYIGAIVGGPRVSVLGTFWDSCWGHVVLWSCIHSGWREVSWVSQSSMIAKSLVSVARASRSRFLAACAFLLAAEMSGMAASLSETAGSECSLFRVSSFEVFGVGVEESLLSLVEVPLLSSLLACSLRFPAGVTSVRLTGPVEDGVVGLAMAAYDLASAEPPPLAIFDPLPPSGWPQNRVFFWFWHFVKAFMCDWVDLGEAKFLLDLAFILVWLVVISCCLMCFLCVRACAEVKWW